MKTNQEMMINRGQPEYHNAFWAAMHGVKASAFALDDGWSKSTGSYALPSYSSNTLEKSLLEESVLRKVCTVIKKAIDESKIWIADSDDVATFVPEFDEIPISEFRDDFTRLPVDRFKLATLLRIPTDFITDAGFDLETYLVKRIAKAIAFAEDKAFITGNGTTEPTGLLHETDGAEIGKTTDSLTLDNLLELYFSVRPTYRKNGVWLMNDETALLLKKLKDEDGDYLWGGGEETFMGKPVLISEYMPNADPGAKPILFGDFSQYWIIRRSEITVKKLRELFALSNQTGYMAYEFLDGKLLHRDAVKALQITAA